MKRITCLFLLAILFTACTSVKQIGKVSVISNRNMDLESKYKVLSAYSGEINKDIKKSKAKSIEEAVDKTVAKVPGGEFIMNVKIFSVKEKYFAVAGDVWGK